MIKIENLHVEKSGHKILKGVNLLIDNGIHVIMGANGSGKSTLSYSIAGHPDCEITQGSITFKGKDITQDEAFERSIQGIYLAPQYPPSIEGLSHAALLKEAINVRREAQGLDPIDEFDFLKELRQKAQEYSFNPKTYVRQSFNVGFSGGEKKRNEMLQISLLKPDFIILDELDSGLDLEATNIIVEHIKEIAKTTPVLMITHYPHIVEAVQAQYVHIMRDGIIVKSGDANLAKEVQENGFSSF